MRKSLRALAIVSGAAMLASAAPSTPVGPLRVGAARVDITPATDELVAPFNAIADPIHVRALLIENDGNRALVVIADVPTISAKVSAELIAKLSAQARVPRENIVLGTTHTHNALRVATEPGILLPASPRFVARVTAATLAAAREAEGSLQPARAEVAKGSARLVGNRNQWSPEHGRYIAGVDRSGAEPIDQTLGVMKFETLAGKPIALLLNYAIEPVVAMAIPAEISGDVPGMVSRTIEERLDGAVALFTVGAAGTPFYRAEETPAPKRRAHAFALIQAFGTILADEALAVAATMPAGRTELPIRGTARQLVCPGKATTPLNLPNRCAHAPGSTLPACDFKDRDADPVALNMGVVRIGDLAIVQADANVTPALGAKLQRVTPAANTWIVALTYGPMHYVMDDAAYAQNTYEATASTAKKGCAEQGFLEGSVAMMRALR